MVMTLTTHKINPNVPFPKLSLAALCPSRFVDKWKVCIWFSNFDGKVQAGLFERCWRYRWFLANSIEWEWEWEWEGYWEYLEQERPASTFLTYNVQFCTKHIYDGILNLSACALFPKSQSCACLWCKGRHCVYQQRHGVCIAAVIEILMLHTAICPSAGHWRMI